MLLHCLAFSVIGSICLSGLGWSSQLLQEPFSLWYWWKDDYRMMCIIQYWDYIEIVLGMPRIPTRSMFKGGVWVQVRSSSTACQHWYVWWHGNSMYGLHQRKMPERFMQIFSPSFTFTRKSKSCSTATDIVTIGMCCIIIVLVVVMQ